MSQMPGPEELREKPLGQMVEDVMQESQQALERGAAITAEVNEIRRRVDNAMDWRVQFQKHTWWVMGCVFAVTALAGALSARD